MSEPTNHSALWLPIPHEMWVSACDEAAKLGVDAYTLLASQYFDRPYGEVSQQQRAAVKCSVFGYAYSSSSPIIKVRRSELDD